MKKVTLAWVFIFYCIILYLQKAAGKVNPYCPKIQPLVNL